MSPCVLKWTTNFLFCCAIRIYFWIYSFRNWKSWWVFGVFFSLLANTMNVCGYGDWFVASSHYCHWLSCLSMRYVGVYEWCAGMHDNKRNFIFADSEYCKILIYIFKSSILRFSLISSSSHCVFVCFEFSTFSPLLCPHKCMPADK